MGRDESALARPERQGTVAVRRWSVALAPSRALAVIEQQSDLIRRAPEREDATSRLGHEGHVFVERAEDGGVVLWRRPDRNWAFKVAGTAEPVPYPDMLHLAAQPTPDGSEVVATWRRHPATTKSRYWLVIGAVVLALMYPLYMGLGLWVLPLFVASLTPGIVRQRGLRSARTSLLTVANAPLAPHELGPADVEGSAFRVRHEREPHEP